MSKEDILGNLYRVWGDKPLDHLFNHESVEFYTDLYCENISEDEYLEYARKQSKEVN